MNMEPANILILQITNLGQFLFDFGLKKWSLSRSQPPYLPSPPFPHPPSLFYCVLWYAVIAQRSHGCKLPNSLTFLINFHLFIFRIWPGHLGSTSTFQPSTWPTSIGRCSSMFVAILQCSPAMIRIRRNYSKGMWVFLIYAQCVRWDCRLHSSVTIAFFIWLQISPKKWYELVYS